MSKYAGWEGLSEADVKRLGATMSAPPKPKSKYHAEPTTVDGIRFASKKEAKRYGELKLLEKAGEIWDLELQPKFPLVVAATTGTLMGAAKALAGTFVGRIGEYRGDFSYLGRSGRVVEDVKGFKTPLYKWKKKHVEIQYGLTIVEV